MKRGETYVLPFEVDELSYDEAVSIAADTGVIAGDAGPLLETVVDMLDELGRPDEHFDCIQVAGTNGKTSTTRFTAAILRGEGKRTALYTSPQLVRYEERMEIDGAVVSPGEFAHGVSSALQLYTSPQLVRYEERMEIDGAVVSPGEFAHGVSSALQAGRRVNARRAAAGEPAYTITPFDLLTAAAMVVFAERGVDVAVLEVGMGGRWDATSATDPVEPAYTITPFDLLTAAAMVVFAERGVDVAVLEVGMGGRWDATSATDPVAVAITGIGLDHTRILGDTLEAIAGEKAAVIRPGRLVVG